MKGEFGKENANREACIISHQQGRLYIHQMLVNVIITIQNMYMIMHMIMYMINHVR